MSRGCLAIKARQHRERDIMLFTLFLIILFLGSVGMLWHRVSEKIPQLVAIPDEVIVVRLHEDSARVRIFLLHARTFWREPRYREAFWHFCEKICYRIHIVFLKMDNGLMIWAKRARANAGTANAETLDATIVPRGEEPAEAAYTPVLSTVISAPRISFASSFAAPPGIMPADTRSLARFAPSPSSTPRVASPRIQEVRKKRTKSPLATEKIV